MATNLSMLLTVAEYLVTPMSEHNDVIYPTNPLRMTFLQLFQTEELPGDRKHEKWGKVSKTRVFHHDFSCTGL